MSVLAERLNAALEGRYRIQRQLGEGGMATVYLADDLRHGRKVALKVLKPELAAVVGAERFLAEIKTTANLQHPHILPLFGSGEAAGFLFYVMPYIDGESLREKLERERQLPVDEAVQIATSIAEALEYAHRKGVIHRDVKPANILIHDGQAVVSDFGIALALGVAEDGRLTRSGVGVGTPSYASPEQAGGGDEVDARADIYSLACVLHEMLTGEPVFTARSSRAVVAMHLGVQPTPIRALRSAVPEGVERAILKGLQKSPVDRFVSMSEFAAAIREGVADSRHGRPLADVLRRHAILVTALAVVIVGGAALVTRQRNPGPAWVDRPTSLVVLPFSDATSTPEEVALSVELSEVAAREINRWDPVNAFRPVDLAGPRMDMGLGTASLERIDDGITLAREVRAEALLALTVAIEGDSASVEAQLYEARTARRVDGPSFSSGALGSSTRILAPILAKVLGFGNAAEPTRAFRAGTRDPEAAAEYLVGVEDLYRNQLEAAETRFRRAIERDPTFATALTSLGQTLFWRWVESGEALADLGPEIALRSTAAMDYLAGLSDLNRLRVRGFYAFQLGDYEQARSLYRSVRESDPNDLLALMMIGEIEISDPWMASEDGKPLLPRSDLSLALESLLETVTLVPTFELGYGRMLTLQASVEAALGGTCGVFDEIREPLVPPWSHFTPSESAALFCPAVQDSITWMPMSEYAASDASALRQGADRLLERFASAFERWASFSPQQPRALERLSEVRLIQRRRAGPAAPERLRQLGQEALDYLSQSLALRADTTAEQLARLANLYLAAGQRAQGVQVAREVSNRYARSDPAGLRAQPSMLDNPLVVGGQTTSALAVASGVQAQRFARSPSTPTVIAYAGAEPIVERIRVLGSMGIGGPLLRAELEQLGSTWSIVGYSASDQGLLRNTVTPSLASALLTDSIALRTWAASVTMDRPLWQALTALYDEPGLARELYASAVANESDGLRSATQTFVLGGISAALGLHSEAIGHYSLLDSIPHSVDYFDPGWGLQVLSHALRAEQYEQLGQLDAAGEQLSVFIDARVESDSLALPGLQAARRDLARIQGALRGLR